MGRRVRTSTTGAASLPFPNTTHQRYPAHVRIALTLALALSVPILAACGPRPPPRYVVEKDVGLYKFRRYQQVLDIEIGIEGNDAVGHTATYVRGGKSVLVAPVFVTVYHQAAGLAETVRQRLRGMTGYSFDIVKLSGEHVFRMRGEGQGGDVWLLWVSGPVLVKLGAPEGTSEVPGELLELYLEKYPSDLDAKGKAEKGAASAGAALGSEGAEPTPSGAAPAGPASSVEGKP